MFRPQLKRGSLSSPLTQNANTLITSSRISERTSSKNKEQSLVPEAFLKESKNLVFKNSLAGLTASLNTSEYEYPKIVEDEITNEAPGTLELLEEIFCFYKLNNIYFWQYVNDMSVMKKMIKHTCEQPISAVYYKQVLFKDFGDKNIILVAIAFGTFVKLFRLQNFEKENNLQSGFLDDLKISIYSPEIVTNLKIILHENKDEYEKNSLQIIIGDANAKLILFDMETKRKHSVDTIQEKIKRKVQTQTYSEIVQIVPYKQYIVCLVKRHYESETIWKKLRRFIGTHKEHVQVEQRVEIYKMRLNVSDHRIFDKSAFTNYKINAFTKYAEFTTEAISNKIKTSFTKFFQTSSNSNGTFLGHIESMNLKSGFIQLMFESGISVLVDQDMSFAETPYPCIKKPNNFAIITKNNVSLQEDITEKSILLKSTGTDMMIFEDFIASQDKTILYASPFLNRESSSLIRSIKVFGNDDMEEREGEKNNKFVIFGLKSMSLVQKVDLKLAIFIYCMVLEKEFPLKKYNPQPKKFEEKLETIFEYYGEAKVIVALLEFLIKVKLYDHFAINIRLDLFELAVKEISTDTQLTFKEAAQLYEQNDKNYLTNTTFEFNKSVEEMIWRVILKCEKVKIEVPTLSMWHLENIEAICMAIQVTISEIFKPIKDWTPKNFCFNRDVVYRIISYSKILIDLIDVFVRREAEGSSRRSIQIHEFLSQNSKNISSLMQSGQSLKIKFCLLSKTTLEKLTLLLKMYDYICEMNLHGTEIPKFSDLLFNSNQSHLFSFSLTILKTLCVNNEALIESLNYNVPELKLDQARKYNQWIESKNIKPNDENNKTFDNSFEDEIEEVTEFLNKENYEEVKRIYFTPKSDGNSENNVFVKEISTLETERTKSLHFLHGTILLLKVCLKKIQDLRQEEIKTFNIISLYEKNSADYYGILEIPSLEIKAAGLLKEIQYFTKSCEELLNQIFLKYSQMIISKEEIFSVLEAIKGELTIEIRRNIENNLAKTDLNSLSESVSRRQLFTKNKLLCKKSMGENLAGDQLANEILRKFK